MRIVLAGDHWGVELKAELIGVLREHGHETLDLGANDATPSDYPDWARALGAAIRDGRAERGVLICGSGVGASVAATKIDGIRAAICHDVYSAHQGVEHDDMNVLCLGSRIVGGALASEIVLSFVTASFNTEEPRYARRLAKVDEIERDRR
jgi:RpiB/LacA/LacB family sugar-phosphate isomerase